MLLTSFSPPDDDIGPADAMVTIAVAYSLPDATVMQTTLRAYGIPSVAIGAAQASIDWFWLFALGGIHIRVPMRLRETAIALIPDLANPRLKSEIAEEIKARGGPYGRKRLLIALLMMPGQLLAVCTLWLGIILINAVFGKNERSQNS